MTKEEPILSVVVPVYNRAHIVGRLLDSLVAQTLRPIAIILVDNESTDSTVEVLKQWATLHDAPDFRVTILSEPVHSAAAARRRGLDAVTTPYVLFFDSDDEMKPSHCEDFVRYLENHPNVDIVGRDVFHTFLSGKRRRMRFGRSLRSHIFHASLATIRYVVRTDVIRRAGGWIDSVRFWDDYELGVRLLLTRPSISSLGGEVTAFSYQTERSITGTDFSSNAGGWEYALDLVEQSLQKARKHRELRWVEMRRVDLAAQYVREGRYDLGAKLLGEVLSREKSAYRRLVYKTAFRWVKSGLRGYALFSRLL